MRVFVLFCFLCVLFNFIGWIVLLSAKLSQSSTGSSGMSEEGKHVMISYQWKSQERMSRLRDKLKKEGYNVWMDIDKMGKNQI